MSRAWLTFWECAVCLSLMTGCVSKAKARQDAQAAFIAGQQEATRRAQMAVQGPSVTINGPVNTPVLPWTEDLTLAKAILRAEYTASGEPAEVFLVRSGRAFRLDLQQLFSGHDVPLEPGDIIQLNATRSGPQ